MEVGRKTWDVRRESGKVLLVLLLTSYVARIAGAATIRGFVKFPGETPPRNMFANASDGDCPRGIAQNHLLVKQETRGLKNALVVLERADRRVMPTRLQAELSSVGCELLPRVQWVPLGTSLLLVNKDGAHHHLHAWRRGNTLFEADLARDSPPARRPLVVPGLYKINCDRHLWERAWIYVSPHDSVAVTDSDGKFVVKNVPIGNYRIRAWHEGWEKNEGNAGGRPEFVPMQDIREVQVNENENAEVLFGELSPDVDGRISN